LRAGAARKVTPRVLWHGGLWRKSVTACPADLEFRHQRTLGVTAEVWPFVRLGVQLLHRSTIVTQRCFLLNDNKLLVISARKGTLCDVAHNNQNTELAAQADPDALGDAVESLFQPLARMLVRQGVGARSTLELVKRAYVSATIDVLKERDLPITTARLSVFTGLTSREIDNITSSERRGGDGAPSSLADVPAVLMMAWHEDSRYAFTLAGTPYELDYDLASGKPSFTALVREFAPGHEPGDLLQELIRSGAARINPETNRIQAVSRAFIAQPYSKASVKRLERLLRNFTDTLYENFQTPEAEARRFERNVIADFAIDEEAEEAFRVTVRTQAQPFLESLDKWLQEQPPAAENGRRVGVAVFGFLEPQEYSVGTVANAPLRPKRLPGFPGVERSASTTSSLDLKVVRDSDAQPGVSDRHKDDKGT
jgi:hypothetical protein